RRAEPPSCSAGSPPASGGSKRKPKRAPCRARGASWKVACDLLVFRSLRRVEERERRGVAYACIGAGESRQGPGTRCPGPCPAALDEGVRAVLQKGRARVSVSRVEAVVDPPPPVGEVGDLGLVLAKYSNVVGWETEVIENVQLQGTSPSEVRPHD